MLWSELIAASMRMMGVLPTGTTPSATEVSDGMALANEMFESWGCEEDLAYGIANMSGMTVSGTAAHTVATSGAAPIWTANPIPDKIEFAECFPFGGIRQSIDVITSREFHAIPDAMTTGPIPHKIAYDLMPGATMGLVSLWPVPNGAFAVVLYYLLKVLNNYTSSATVALPRGYQHAARYNLAARWALEFGVPADVLAPIAAIAKETLDAIRVQNKNLREAVKAIKTMPMEQQVAALKALQQQAA